MLPEFHRLGLTERALPIFVFCHVNCLVPLHVPFFLGVREGTRIFLFKLFFEGDHDARSLMFLLICQSRETTFEAAATGINFLCNTPKPHELSVINYLFEVFKYRLVHFIK